ncbi:hypothetical protein P4N68_02045 [Corynebacterium felinum]|uniref:2TM domain-containing protein n=1 Tax=Corynebacterium felinum TaxID=131318 RepID=A0ABU2BDF9_9CORY|nr:hypothetical protein [Corynebacterium felinum]MDF5819863.1 hypothetical protein [Corynebacterium felinum]MDR7355994.1 hypothetical protein [Corynebacterium felinum]
MGALDGRNGSKLHAAHAFKRAMGDHVLGNDTDVDGLSTIMPNPAAPPSHALHYPATGTHGKHSLSEALRALFLMLFLASILNIIIWAGLAFAGNVMYFWPIWIIIPLLIVFGLKYAVDKNRAKDSEGG